MKLESRCIEVIDRINTGRSFVLSTHTRIDGDGLGSVLALSSVLDELGKPNLVLLPDAVPKVYAFLPGVERAVTVKPGSPPALPDDLDTLIMLDAPEFARLASVQEALPKDLFSVKIDHHQPGATSADIELVDTAASSAAEVLYRVLRGGDFPITHEAALNLYVAVLTDTGRFCLPNTTAECMRMCADLIALGVEPGPIGDRLYRSYPSGLIALRSELASGLRFLADGRIAVAVLTREMLNRHKVDLADTQDFADISREVAGVEVGVFLRELDEDATWKISLRSSRISVLDAVRHFGGGGHALAAGCTIPGPLEAALDGIVGQLEPLIAKGTP